MSTTPAGTSTPSPSRGVVALVVAALVGVVGAGGLGVWFLLPADEPEVQPASDEQRMSEEQQRALAEDIGYLDRSME